MKNAPQPHAPSTQSPPRRAHRSRWAAIGAAVAVTLGAGSLTVVNATGSAPSSFVSITPERVLDTRAGNDVGLSGPFTSPTSRTLQITGSVPTATGTKTVVPPGATGVVMNVTAVQPTADGFISVRPDGTPGAPTTSNLNFAAGDIIPNSVTVALPPSGVIEITYDAFANVGPTTDVLIDVTGYFVPASGEGSGEGSGDTLDGLSCAPGEIAKWSGSAWECAVDAGSVGYAYVITVAKSGGDHTSVAAALDSISDSSSTNRYLVRVAPGVYTETNLVEVPPYVHLRGDGPATTVITSARGAATQGDAAATMHVLEHGVVSDLTVRNTGTGIYGIAILTTQTSRATLIDNVVSEAVGAGGTGHYAAYLNDAEPIIRNSTLRADGAGVVNAAVGVVNITGAFPQPLIERSKLLGGNVAADGKSCSGNTASGIGIQASSAAPQVFDSYICGDFRSVAALTAGTARLHSSQLAVTASPTTFLVETTGSGAVLAITSGVFHNPPSSNKQTGGGNGITCAQSYGANGSQIGASCD